MAGAVGYVLEQIELEAQQPKLLEHERIKKPAALFESALAHGWKCTLPGWEDDPEAPRRGGTDPDADLWTTLREMLRRRIPPGTWEIAFKRAALRRDGLMFTVVCRDAFAVTTARSAEPIAQRCLDRLGFSGARIAIVSESAGVPIRHPSSTAMQNDRASDAKPRATAYTAPVERQDEESREP